MPYDSATLSLYEAQILQARDRSLQLVDNQQAFMRESLIELHEDLGKRMAELDFIGEGDTLKRQHLSKIQHDLESLLGDKLRIISDDIVNSMHISAKLRTDAEEKFALNIVGDLNPNLTKGFPYVFAKVRDDAVKSVMARMYDDKKTFSKRIWNLDKYSKNVISQTIAKAVAEGKSHTNLMKDLRAFLLMTPEESAAYERALRKEKGPTWVMDKRLKNRMNYNLQRIARTEINNAHREAGIQSAKTVPWVKGCKWNLSAKHTVPDICDRWATQDAYKLGPGGYPPDQTPIDHPNGWCNVTDILVSRDEFLGIVSKQSEELFPETAKKVVAPQPEIKPRKARPPAKREIKEKPVITPVEKPKPEIKKEGGKASAEKVRADIKQEAAKALKEKKQLTTKAAELEKQYKTAPTQAARTKIKNELAATQKQILEADRQVAERIRENYLLSAPSEKKLSMRESFGNSIMGERRVEISASDMAEMKKAVDTLERMFDPKALEKILPKGAEIKVMGIGTKRSFLNPFDKTIAMGTSDGKILIHEIGHYIETSNNDIFKKIQQHYAGRTKEEKTQLLATLLNNKGYGSETTKVDKFIHAYMGKYYRDMPDNTEVFSMGLEYMYSDPVGLATKDPDTFDFIFGILKGL